jgi:hypothetical protein
MPVTTNSLISLKFQAIDSSELYKGIKLEMKLGLEYPTPKTGNY